MENNENTTINNTGNTTPSNNGSKNSLMIIIVAVIILAIVAVIVLNNNQKNMQPTENQEQIPADLNNALSSDTTKDINSNLDKINLEDTSDTDLKDVDNELEKL